MDHPVLDKLNVKASVAHNRKSELPHVMVIDLGDVQQLSGFDYLPRAEQGAPGSIKDYKIFVW
jgi:beta-galactosidase